MSESPASQVKSSRRSQHQFRYECVTWYSSRSPPELQRYLPQQKFRQAVQRCFVQLLSVRVRSRVAFDSACYSQPGSAEPSRRSVLWQPGSRYDTMMRRPVACGAFISWSVLLFLSNASVLLTCVAAARSADGSSPVSGCREGAESSDALVGSWLSRFSELTREYLPSFLQLWDLRVPPDELPE